MDSEAGKRRFYFKPWAKSVLKAVLPAACVRSLVRVQNYVYSRRAFDHARAQKYELEDSIIHTQRIKPLVDAQYAEVQDFKRRGAYGPDAEVKKLFFNDDQRRWEAFAASIKGKRCMELGAGQVGVLSRWWWVRDRIIVEPLLDDYQKASLDVFGKTFFTDDMKLFSRNAEDFIEEYRGNVDGAIIMINMIDHVEKPFLIMENVARYAAPGCTLLFWSALYYPRGHNEGHRNVAEDPRKIEDFLKNIGFRIEVVVPPEILPSPQGQINYGCRAVKS